MRIDGPEGLESPHLPAKSPSPGKSNVPARPPGVDALDLDDQLRSQSTQHIKEALAGDEINTQAVAEARKLLKSGELETPEAIRRAAEAILTLGQ